MVGITMVLAIAICIFGAAGLFAWLSRPFSDLIPMVAPAAQIQATSAPVDSTGGQPAAEPPAPAAQLSEVPTVAPDAAATEPTAAPNPDDFQPTHQIGASQSVNFRSGPSTADPVIVALPPATALEYLDEDEPTTNPADGDRWMRFRTENGDEGWIREIDTEPYQP
jgi:hypothetical protein